MAPGAEADESLRVVDELSMHTGCPPAEGQIKWTATVWMHYEPFRPESFSKAFPKRPVPDRADCTNVEPRCDEWARMLPPHPCAAAALLHACISWDVGLRSVGELCRSRGGRVGAPVHVRHACVTHSHPPRWLQL